MARPCSICPRHDRPEIDAALLAGTPFRNISKRSGTSLGALWRHRSEHLTETLASAVEARRAEAEADPSPTPAPATPERSRRQDAAEALDVVGQLKAINSATLRVLADARQAGDGRLVLLAVDRAQRQIELQAKLLGDLDDRPQVTLVTSPEWMVVRATLIAALRPYPDAGVAVAEALVALESA